MLAARHAAAVVGTVLVVSALSAAQRYDVPVGSSPHLGPPDAPVTIVEFIDYQ